MLGHLEVGDDAAAEGTDGLDVFVVGAAIHAHGFLTHGDDFVVVTIYGHDGWLVDNHLVVVYNNGVGGSQVHGHFTVEER